MMNEPKYVVYLFKIKGFNLLRLNIIKWDTKEIWETIDIPDKLSHLKKLNIRKIDQIIENSFYLPLSLDNIPRWRDKLNENNKNLYKSPTIENIREVIETLEEAELSYMYFVYEPEPLKPLYMSNNCQSGQQARSTGDSK